MFDIEILYDDKRRFELASQLFKQEVGDDFYDPSDSMQTTTIDDISMWLKHYRTDNPLQWDQIMRTVKNFAQDNVNLHNELYALHFGGNDNNTLTTPQNTEDQS